MKANKWLIFWVCLFMVSLSGLFFCALFLSTYFDSQWPMLVSTILVLVSTGGIAKISN
jgi:hypothetical protein